MNWRWLVGCLLGVILMVTLGQIVAQVQPSTKSPVATTVTPAPTAVKKLPVETRVKTPVLVPLTEREKKLQALGFSPTKTHRIAVKGEK